MENITSVNYRHGKSFKNIGGYLDLYVRSDKLLLADIFENLRNKCIKIQELDLANFLSAPGLAWQACLKKAGIKLELLIDVKMLLMVETGIRDGIYHAMHRYGEANNKYMKNDNKDKNS